MNKVKTIFWDANQHRLRAPWRLGIQFNLFIAILVGSSILSKGAGQGLMAAVLGSVLYFGAGLILAWFMARFIDRRPFADFGFHCSRSWWIDFGFGLALGAILMTGLFLAELMAGWVSVTGAAVGVTGQYAVLAFLVSVIAYTAVGFNEELTFRGYQLKNLAEGLVGKRLSPQAAVILAFVVSSVFFGLAHITNANATALSTLNIIAAGLLLALPYLLSGELAISIGIHITWNLFEGSVYGFAVSGNAPTRHLLTIQQSGPELWTGGLFGPEAGLLAVIAILVGCALTVLWVKWRYNKVGIKMEISQYQPRSPVEQLGD